MADTTHKLVLPSLEPRKLIVANKATSRSNPAEAGSHFGKGDALMVTPTSRPPQLHGQQML
jgi:hypothetical protein